MEFTASVVHIGEHAFSGCNLDSAYLFGNAPVIGYEAFHGSGKDFKIYHLANRT